MSADTVTAPTFRLGINYWPASTAMAWWSSFDSGEFAGDLDRIKASGLDSVRLFLTWEDFQPDPQRVDTQMLARLIRVADVAAEAGLAIMPTLFTGHMSGVNFIPPWALAGCEDSPRFRVVSAGSTSRRTLVNWFGDAVVTDAQVLLARHAAAALQGHPALWAWDLGNENSNCSIPPDAVSGSVWLGRVTDAIRGSDDATAITIGLHMEDLEENRNIGPAAAASVCDFLTMHGYPIYAPWARGPTDEHLLGFLTKVTRWLAGGTDVLFSEFGLPTVAADTGVPADASSMLVEEAVAASYTHRALGVLRAAGATGAMLWCYSDYDPSIWQTPPLDEAIHERSFGLWRADGSAKPAVDALVRHRGASVEQGTDDQQWIDIARGEFYMQQGTHLARLYTRYLDALATPA